MRRGWHGSDPRRSLVRVGVCRLDRKARGTGFAETDLARRDGVLIIEELEIGMGPVGVSDNNLKQPWMECHLCV